MAGIFLGSLDAIALPRYAGYDVVIAVFVLISALVLLLAKAAVQRTGASSDLKLVAPLVLDVETPSSPLRAVHKPPVAAKTKKSRRQRERARTSTASVGSTDDVEVQVPPPDVGDSLEGLDVAEQTTAAPAAVLLEVEDAGSAVDLVISPEFIEEPSDDIVQDERTQQFPDDVELRGVNGITMVSDHLQHDALGNGTQNCSYGRVLLLAHRSINLRIARGPPGLELPAGFCRTQLGFGTLSAEAVAKSTAARS